MVIIFSMNTENPITKAIGLIGLVPLAEACGKTYQAVRKWEKKGGLPRTDYTGETDYASKIVEATNNQVTMEELRPTRTTDAA